MLLRLASLILLAGTLLLNLSPKIAAFVMRLKTSKRFYVVFLSSALLLPVTVFLPDLHFALKALLWGLQGASSGVLFLFFGTALNLHCERDFEKRGAFFPQLRDRSYVFRFGDVRSSGIPHHVHNGFRGDVCSSVLHIFKQVESA